MIASNCGNSFNDKGAAKKRFGPINEENDALSLHTGSVKMRLPSISVNRLECPIHVMRSPDAGIVLYTAISVEKGPNTCLGIVSSLLVKYFHMIESMLPPVDISVGTGFKNFFPSLRECCKKSITDVYMIY